MEIRYTIYITTRGVNATLTARTYKEVADLINACVGYKMVSQNVIINWLSRNKKSKKYDFVRVVRGFEHEAVSS